MRRLFTALVFLAFLIFILSGCSSRQQTLKFQQAYQLLNANPDSSLTLLRQMDKHTLSERDLAYYSLLHTIAQDKSGEDVREDSLLRFAFEYYRHRETDSMYARCMHYMGVYYSLNDSIHLAENCYHRSIQKSRERKDYYTCYLSLDRLANILSGTDPKIAVRYAQEAYSLYQEHFGNNLYNRVYLLQGISMCYNNASMPDSAQVYLDLAVRYAKESESKELLSSVYQSMSVVKQESEQPDSALFYAREAWNIAPVRSTSLALKLAYSYILADSIDQSMQLLEHLCQNSSLYTRQTAYKLLTECAFRKGNLTLAWESADSALTLYKKKYEQALQDRSIYFSANYEKQTQLEQARLEKQLHELLLTGLILFAVFILLIVIQYGRTRALKLKHEYEKELLCHRLNEEKQRLISVQKEQQNKLLKSYIKSKIGLEERLSEILGTDAPSVLIDEDTWKDIEQFLNAAGDDFVIKLREMFPYLTQNDLRFCMLLRLDFSIKDLSRTYHIAEVSVKQKQNKFKQKLGLENSSQSLRKYLQSL